MKQITMNIRTLPYAVEEAMNRLRINIKFCGKNTKKILVISSVPNDGKKYCVRASLEDAGGSRISFCSGRSGPSEVGDERPAGFQSEGEITGLDYYLSGLSEYQDVVYETNVNNGYIVPVSNLLENPSALLEDPRMGELLDRLAKDYRYVIIDSPPLDSVADGALIASLCDGVLLVVRSGMTSRKLVRQSLQQLERVHCRLLGMVLNRVGDKESCLPEILWVNTGTTTVIITAEKSQKKERTDSRSVIFKNTVIITFSAFWRGSCLHRRAEDANYKYGQIIIRQRG